jgi:hypothetical protein
LAKHKALKTHSFESPTPGKKATPLEIFPGRIFASSIHRSTLRIRFFHLFIA